MKVEIKLDWKSDFPKARKAALVTDSNVDPLHGDAFVRSLEDGGWYDRVERIDLVEMDALLQQEANVLFSE